MKNYQQYEQILQQEKQLNQELFEQNIKLVYKFTNKYQGKIFHEDLEQDMKIHLYETIAKWDNQLNSFEAYLITNLKWFIKSWWKENKKHYQDTVFNDKAAEWITDDNNTRLLDDITLYDSFKEVKNFKDIYISDNGEVVNMQTEKKLKNTNGWVNVKKSKLNVKKLMKQYWNK